MERAEAWRVMGIDPTDDVKRVRGRYLERLVEVHPDRSAAPDANDATVALNDAYRIIVEWIGSRTRSSGAGIGFGPGGRVGPSGRFRDGASGAGPGGGFGPSGADGFGRPPWQGGRSGQQSDVDDSPPLGSSEFGGKPVEIVPISMIDSDTIAVGAPAAETYYLLTEAAHDLGEIAHYDPSSAMLSIIVEFVDEPVCQILCVLQGRATGVTEIFISLDSLDSTPAPPIDAVTRLFLDAMVTVSRRQN